MQHELRVSFTLFWLARQRVVTWADEPEFSAERGYFQISCSCGYCVEVKGEFVSCQLTMNAQGADFPHQKALAEGWDCLQVALQHGAGRQVASYWSFDTALITFNKMCSQGIASLQNQEVFVSARSLESRAISSAIWSLFGGKMCFW